jgi:hypothetical protein
MLCLSSSTSPHASIINYTRFNVIYGEDMTMKRSQERSSAEGYCIQILIVNGEVQSDLSQKSYYIENIGKGGFRFISDAQFELEDRVQVLLRFPDGRSQEVLGRICYSDTVEENLMAYGFSVLDGFYSLHETVK